MKDTDSLLIGTSWTRAGTQKHSPTTGIIDSIGSRGPRLKAEHKYHRLVWMELGFSWVPADRRSEKAYDLWQLANRADYLEKKLEDLQTVESEIVEVPENGVLIVGEPELGVKECHGPWHRHGDRYDLIALSEFRPLTRGPRKGELASICIHCQTKQRDSDRRRKGRKELAPKVAALPEPIVIEPVIETDTGEIYRWKVTVIQKVEHFVQGKDFLDAAAQLSGTGEVVKVEKL